MADYLGAIATILFCLASLAQALKSIREGHSNGISHGLIWMLLIGFLFMTVYVVITIGFDWILLLSYIIQLFLYSIIAYYKYKPPR